MRAIDCTCGHHFQAADDERTDEQLRDRIAADESDAEVSASA
jgi:hypothetical protein